MSPIPKNHAANAAWRVAPIAIGAAGVLLAPHQATAAITLVVLALALAAGPGLRTVASVKPRPVLIGAITVAGFAFTRIWVMAPEVKSGLFGAGELNYAVWLLADMACLPLLLAAPPLVYKVCERFASRSDHAFASPWRLINTRQRRNSGTEGPRMVLMIGGFALVYLYAWIRFPAHLDIGGAWSEVVNAQIIIVVGLLTFASFVVAPVLGLGNAGRRDRRERDLALNRQAVAAHLHDSVLQTFALIQRQINDPEAVGRLVRKQEAELRAWLSGADEQITGAQLSQALRTVADEVEAEHNVKIELDALSDQPSSGQTQPLLQATREALRNAARHALGAEIRVLLECNAKESIVFVRDSGGGFEPQLIPTQRRGIRDSIIARMQGAGGSAEIDSAPGQGTEVVLRLPNSKT